jgi:hypothetical protein
LNATTESPVSIIPQVPLAIYIYIYHRFSAQLRIMNNGDFIVNLDFPKNGTERGTWNSPVKDVLYQMREIFKRLPKDDWFTYISKLLPLLDEDCVDEDIYDSLEDLVDQHPCLIQFHRLLVEEFVPELVQTFKPALAAAYPWEFATDDMSDEFIEFSCQREREVETGGFKDEGEQRSHAAIFIDEELSSREGKAFVENQSREDQEKLIALLQGLHVDPARADAAALARDPELSELADGFAYTMRLD